MGSRVWKDAEKKAAKEFGVKRNIQRGANFSQDLPDTTPHPLFSIEVKSRKRVSSFLKDGLEQAARYDKEKLPILYIHEVSKQDDVIVMKMKHFRLILKAMEGFDYDKICNNDCGDSKSP